MAKLYNLARMTSSTTGTGTITLGSAVSGYLTFALAGAASGDVVDYAIKDGANSEIGTGTYTVAAGPVYTLTRTVTKSTNSNAAISLSGAAEVFISPRAETLDIEFNRRNSLLDLIYQSKSFAEYRRGVNVFATGFKGASDALNGILTGSSSNYTVTPGTAGAATGNVTPSATAGPDQVPTMTTNTAPAGYTASASSVYDGSTPAFKAFDKSVVAYPTGEWASAGTPSGGSPEWVQLQFPSGVTAATYKITGRISSSVSSPTAFKLRGSNNGSTWIDLDTQSGLSWSNAEQKTFTIASPASYTYYRMEATATSGGGVVGVAEISILTAAVSNNMTLVTAAQTADSAVSNGRVLIEYDNTASPALNTDLQIEVTCNGGTNWASATLSAVTSNSQGGRKVAETADTACTSGTDFRARIKTLNNKNVPIYGAAILVE